MEESSSFSAANEEYNGTSWTEIHDLNTARDGCSGAGVHTAAISFGGRTILAISRR
jgi:hypothetical protein